MQSTACAIEYLTSADVARRANRNGDSLTAAGVRVAAATGRLRVAAHTPGGVRLFDPRDVEEFLAVRAAKRQAAAA